MDPYVDITADGKTATCKLDVKSSLYVMVAKKLIDYTMSQDKADLPTSLPLSLMLPKQYRRKIGKAFNGKQMKAVYHIDEVWTYVWESFDFLSSGWYFDGRKV